MRVFPMLFVVAACGDNQLPREPSFVGASGDRLKLQWYLYQDGAQQPEREGFYDGRLHARCTPAKWTDGVTLCTPLGDPAVFTDAACTVLVGRKTADRRPRYFVGYDRVEGELRAARVFTAGDIVATVPTTFYELRDGTCTQVPEQTTIAYYDIGEPIERERMVEVWPEMLADSDDARLALQYLTSSEGLVAPVAFRDRALGIDCRAEQLGDRSVCAPLASVPAQHFVDPTCAEPAAVATTPPGAAVVGCASYHAIGEPLPTTLVYRRDAANACVTYRLATMERAYRIGAPLDLAPVERTIDDDPDRRLQRIALAADNLHLVDTALFDTATRSDCKSFGNGELAVCVPTGTVAGERLFTNASCTRELFVAGVPREQCTASAFAVVSNTSIHAISTPYTGGSLFALDAAMQCRAKTFAVDRVPHVLGPPIPVDTFVGGVVFSER